MWSTNMCKFQTSLLRGQNDNGIELCNVQYLENNPANEYRTHVFFKPFKCTIKSKAMQGTIHRTS